LVVLVAQTEAALVTILAVLAEITVVEVVVAHNVTPAEAQIFVAQAATVALALSVSCGRVAAVHSHQLVRVVHNEFRTLH
jgi:hypothetical protein